MMNSKEALKRLIQETAPATYMVDFDKDECIEVIKNDLERLDKLEKAIKIINDALELYAASDEIGVENRSSFIDYEDSELLKEVLGYESCNI